MSIYWYHRSDHIRSQPTHHIIIFVMPSCAKSYHIIPPTSRWSLLFELSQPASFTYEQIKSVVRIVSASSTQRAYHKINHRSPITVASLFFSSCAFALITRVLCMMMKMWKWKSFVGPPPRPWLDTKKNKCVVLCGEKEFGKACCCCPLSVVSLHKSTTMRQMPRSERKHSLSLCAVL